MIEDTMTLRPYEKLAQRAGITETMSPVSGDSSVGKVVKLIGLNTKSKNFQQKGLSLILGWAFFSMVFIFPNIETSGSNPPFVMIPIFFLGPIVIGVVVFGGYALLIGSLLGFPEAMMSGVVLRRGDTIQIHYKQPIKRNITLKSLTFTLVLQESATYDQGTTTVTERHDKVIDQIADYEVQLSRDTGVDRQLSFVIPDNAMHTFEAYRNQLDWYLRVKLDIPRYPNYHRNYKLRVLPEVNRYES